MSLTQLLKDASNGNRGATDALLEAIYDDLRTLADRQMQAERANHTLQATAVVHEAYLKLIDQRRVEWRDRAHFFAAASEIIRRVLVDHARAHRTAKRGQGRPKLTLHEVAVAMEGDIDLVELDDALGRLASIDAMRARIVELRFFGGLQLDQVSEVLGISESSVKRKWGAAKAWLHRELME